jgi:hypothetical protein
MLYIRIQFLTKLYNTILYPIIQYYIIQYHIVLYYTVLYYAVLYRKGSVLLYSALNWQLFQLYWQLSMRNAETSTFLFVFLTPPMIKFQISYHFPPARSPTMTNGWFVHKTIGNALLTAAHFSFLDRNQNKLSRKFHLATFGFDVENILPTEPRFFSISAIACSWSSSVACSSVESFFPAFLSVLCFVQL